MCLNKFVEGNGIDYAMNKKETRMLTPLAAGFFFCLYRFNIDWETYGIDITQQRIFIMLILKKKRNTHPVFIKQMYISISYFCY